MPEPTRRPYTLGTRQQRGLSMTPGMQSVIDSINANRQALQEQENLDENGPLGIGRAFRGATGFAAKGFKTLGDGVFYAMKALSLTNEYVSKPLLGFGVAVGNGESLDHGINYYRRRWEQADAPGVLKFAAEMAADPLTWVGVGAWKTPSIKLASKLIEGAEAAGVANKTNFITRALKAGSAEWSFSKESRVAIEQLARRGGAVVKKGQFEIIVKDAVRSGLIPKAQAESVLNGLYSGRMLDFSMLRPGWMARLASPTRLGRVFGPIDMFAEAAWSIPFRGAGMVMKPVGEPLAKKIPTMIDRLGQGFPIRQFTWFGSQVGPKVFHDVHDAARSGKLMTWLLRRSDEALNLEGDRMMRRAFMGIDHAAAKLGVDPYEVIRSLRLEDQKIVHGLSTGQITEEPVGRVVQKLMDDDALDALYGAVRRIPDDEFLKLTAVDTDEALKRGLARHMKTWVSDALKGPPLFEKVERDLTVMNRFWGWTEGLVNKWRPIVTSLNPSFQFLNVFSDLTERGGSDLVYRGNAGLVNLLRKHGAPEDLIAGTDNSLAEIARKALKGDKNAIAGLSQFGIRVGKNDPGWIRAAKAMTTRADHGAQAGIMARETGNHWLTMVGGADVDDPMFRIKQFVEEIDKSGLNPEITRQFKEALPYFSRSPKKAAQELSKAFSYENVAKEHLMSGTSFRSMPSEWRNLWSEQYDAGLKEGWDPITAATNATDRSDSVISAHSGSPIKQAYADLAQVEKVRNDMFEAAGITNLAGARKDQAETMRRTMIGYAAAINTFAPKQAEKFFKDRLPSIALANRQVDAMVDTHIALAAADRGLPSMGVLPVVQAWNDRVTGKIAKNMDIIADTLPKYRKAMTAGNMDLAAKHLRTMGKAHGDFVAFREAAELPLPGVLEEQFAMTGERVWTQFIGRKYELADNLIALMDSGQMHPKDIVSILNKGESEVFARVNLPQLREKWAAQVARWSGNAGETLPARVSQLPLTPSELQAHRRMSKDFLQGQYTRNVGQYDQAAEAYRPEFEKHLRSLGLSPDDVPPLNDESIQQLQDQMSGIKNYLAEARIGEQHLGTEGMASPLIGLRTEEQRLNALLDPQLTDNVIMKTTRQIEHVPARPVEEFYKDLQNNYETIGRATIDSVQNMMPNQYTPFMVEQSARVRAEAIKLATNSEQNMKGAQLAQEMIQRYGTMMSRDKQLQLQASKMYREALHTKGLEVMRQRMVDYQNTTNFHKVVSSFLPFAAFQLHLPGYLARTFMERPGVIAAMNHFAQEAQKNHGVTGGLLFGGGFVFAPQLRFSYLPILAGNNFVNPDDHPLNQMTDMLSAFGFSPGPNVQAMAEVGNMFASKVGLGQAAPEFRGGIIPQWRFIQDITAIAGIDGGNGLSVPFIGPSADVREREVRRVLAGRLSERLEMFRKEHGREPYPDEVTALREYVWQNELKSARQEVAIRDVPAFLLPGVRTHDPEYLRIRDKASMWMKVNGIEDVTPKNVATKYRGLNKLQKAALLQTVPEFADILSIPPYQESGQKKQVRVARESFFKNRDLIMADTMREQRKLDAALEGGSITPKMYRDAREDLRTRMAGALNGLEMNPDYKPFMTMERSAPTDPGETAYMDYLKLEPQDLNGNGIIDETDMKVFFNARRDYVKQQPSWVKDYIRNRRENEMTPTEIEFTRAQSTLNDYFDIPKYLGLSKDDSDMAAAVLERVDSIARTMPGRVDRTKLLLSLPNISAQERFLALRAMQSPRNPERFLFWTRHRELEMFYPDMRPSEPGAMTQ